MEAPLVQWSNELRKQEEAALLRDNATELTLTVIQNGAVIGPCDALGLGNRNSIAIDVDVFPLYACLPLRTSYLRPTCHQHLRWPRSDLRIAGRFRVAVVDSRRGLVDFHTHVLGMTDGL